MEFAGTYDFAQDRATVWRALNDPDILRETIPGCTAVDQTGEGAYTAHLKLKFGLLRFGTEGNLRVEVLEPAKSYRLHGQSAQTMFGAGAGVAEVTLNDLPDGGTHLAYDVTSTLEGRLANLGANLVGTQIQSLGHHFFERFEAAMIAAI